MKAITLILLFTISISAQTFVSGLISAGVDYSKNNDFKVQQVVGQVFTGLSKNQNFMLRSGSLFATSGAITSINNRYDEIPKQFFLEQNYPNPFNPETRIKFHLPKESEVYLGVYDILGREVTVLVNELMKPGIYSALLSISKFNLASGIYIYRIKAGEFSAIKKMLLVK